MKEIKIQYEGSKCSKCGREMKKDWKGFFEVIGDKKYLYCTVCAKELQSKRNNENTNVNNIDIENEFITSSLKALIDMVARLGMQLASINEQLSIIVPTKKPAVKKK